MHEGLARWCSATVGAARPAPWRRSGTAPKVSLAAKLGLVPLGLGGVLDHHRLVEPLLLDIAAEAAVVDDPRFGRRMEAAGAWCAEATSAASRLRTPLPLVDGAFFSPYS